MAIRSPRFAYDNLAIRSATTILASSYQTSFPASWLRDAIPTKVWRSKLGWTIYAGFNDKVDFNRGGVLAATIAAGTYATGADLAAAIVTALEAADSTPVWACSYDTGTKKFTISSDLAFTLLFGTGANLATSVAKDLGFAVADTGSSTTHTAGSAAYQSRHWVRFDLGSALAATLGIAHYLNVSSAGVVQLLAKSASDVWVSPDSTVTLAGDDLTRLRAATFATVTKRYWLILIEDVQNSAGFAELGVPFVGTYLEFANRSYDQGYSIETMPLSRLVRSDSGAAFHLLKQKPRRWNVVFANLLDSDRSSYQAMEDAARGAHLFFFTDPLNYLASRTLYGVMPEPATLVQHVGEGTPGDNWDVEFSFEEDLG